MSLRLSTKMSRYTYSRAFTLSLYSSVVASSLTVRNPLYLNQSSTSSGPRTSIVFRRTTRRSTGNGCFSSSAVFVSNTVASRTVLTERQSRSRCLRQQNLKPYLQGTSRSDGSAVFQIFYSKYSQLCFTVASRTAVSSQVFSVIVGAAGRGTSTYSLDLGSSKSSSNIGLGSSYSSLLLKFGNACINAGSGCTYINNSSCIVLAMFNIVLILSNSRFALSLFASY